MENTMQAEQPLEEEAKKNMQAKNLPEKKTTGQENDKVSISSTGLPAEEDLSSTTNSTGVAPEKIQMQVDAEKKISSNVMSISLTSDGLVIKEEDKEEENELSSKLSGVYCEGVQYYDLNGIQYINNTGMAILIDLLKALLEMGVEVQFVNVHDSIKKKIKEMGLEKIINYGENSGT